MTHDKGEGSGFAIPHPPPISLIDALEAAHTKRLAMAANARKRPARKRTSKTEQKANETETE